MKAKVNIVKNKNDIPYPPFPHVALEFKEKRRQGKKIWNVWFSPRNNSMFVLTL